MIAQSVGLETNIKVEKKVYASLNENHFIVLSDNESLLLTIGVSCEDSVYFYKKKHLDEIKKLIKKINAKSSEGHPLKQLTIADAYFSFEYEDCYFLFLRKGDIKLIEQPQDVQ